MFTASADGNDLLRARSHGKTSHFIWRDPQHILAWAWHPVARRQVLPLRGPQTEKVEVVGPDVMTVNGHCTYLPGNRWILNDTYPDKQRNQNLYLYHVATGTRDAAGPFPFARRSTRASGAATRIRVSARTDEGRASTRPTGGQAGRCT